MESYEAVNDYTEDVTVENETVSSTGTDENAIHVSQGASAILKGISVDRESEDSKGGDTSSFYGVGAAILATEGNAYVGKSSITTDAAGGGTLYAWDMNVETNGESSAALRSDRGGGKMVVDGGSLTAKNGGMFYTTNTESTITLSDVDITNAEDSEFFLKCTGNANERGWGTAGDNGADCLFTAVQQEMEGDVVWDSISQLDFYITDGNTVAVKGSDGTVYVEGTGSYTVTVESYSDSADLSGSSEVTQWSDYQVEKPEALA